MRPGVAVRVAVAAVALVVGACGGDEGGGTAGPSPTSAGPTATGSTGPAPSGSTGPTGSPSADPSPEPVLQVPPDAPTRVDDPQDVARVTAGDLRPLVPPGATVTVSAVMTTPEDPLDQITVGWTRGDFFAAEHGLAAWQPLDDGLAWQAVYAFTERPSKGVLGLVLSGEDLTGDRIQDLLVRADTGGSGACAIWRVLVPTPGAVVEAFQRTACDTEISIASAALEVREAVFEPGDPHCCPSAFRTTTLEWDGSTFLENGVREEATG